MTQLPTERYLALKTAMMPRDTNPLGTIFGGVLLSGIDQAGAIGAVYAVRQFGWPEQPLVTVGIKSVEFHQPVFVGDVVSYWTQVVHVGTSSITMHVSVEADQKGENVKVTEAEITYVAFEVRDGQRRPSPIRGS